MAYRELKNAGMDVDEFLNRLMQNESLVKLFVKKFIEDKTYASLTAALDARDSSAAEGASHTLKGVCGNLSLKALFLLFTEQVKLIREGDIDGAVAMMEKIAPTYENAIAHMQEWLKSA